MKIFLRWAINYAFISICGAVFGVLLCFVFPSIVLLTKSVFISALIAAILIVAVSLIIVKIQRILIKYFNEFKRSRK